MVRIAKAANPGDVVQIKFKDNARKWLWGFLAIVALSQLYFVKELVAAFAIFAIGFVAIASVVAGLYMLQHIMALAFARLAVLRQPVMNMAPVNTQNQKAA
ncbi:MAG TPA: hypothetical protein VKH15_03035 [Candidatus Acidoferrum sp.]|nr:hypothetical protein [Candidatus Acidoferrum sp.]